MNAIRLVSPTTRLLLMVLACLAAACAHEPGRPATDLVTEEFMVPAADAGLQLYIRNKHPRDMVAFKPENVVLFVHGATYPAESSFDLPLDGLSWMDYIASRGYDTYMVDIRGYGRSSRPPEMDRAAEASKPIVNTETAARDYGAAVDFIRARRGVEKIDVLGWSWGTAITAYYTSKNNAKVNRLVLYAPVWLRQTQNLADSGAPLGGYRTVTIDAARIRKGTGVPLGKEPMPEAWFNAWAEATFATDPVGASGTPTKYVRAPNGVIEDSREYWSKGKALYEPAEIKVPTLLVLAEWDADTPVYMAQTLFPKLINASPKRLVIIGEGTHSIMNEKNRLQLFSVVQTFFDEARTERWISK